MAVLSSLLLWLALVSFPQPPDTTLDASWQEVLVHAHQQGWQFGREVVFTWGPWGFLNSNFHLGEQSASPRIVWEWLGKLLLAVGLVGLSRRLPLWRQAAFVCVTAVYAPVFQDCAYLLFITLAGFALLLRPTMHRFELLSLVGALAFLAQIKFTYALLGGATVGVATVLPGLRRQWPGALLTAGGFALGFLLWWLAAGQNPDNIVPYLRRSWEISTGYSSAMGFETTLPVVICGCLVLVAGAAFVWRLWHTDAGLIPGRSLALFTTLALFLAWKHGFTRADGHVLGFFFFALPLLLAAPALCFPGPRFHWPDLGPVLCLAGVWFFDPGLPAHIPAETPAKIARNLRSLARTGRLPAQWKDEMQAARAQHALPLITRAVGDGTVDLYNFEQGAVLLNGLRYSPRPVFQGYSAYTARLAGRNLRHHLSSVSARYLLWHHTTIDERFPTLDDAPLLAELPRTHEVALQENNYLLLRRRDTLPPAPLNRNLLGRLTVALDETVTVPEANDAALWVQIHSHSTQLGRLRNALYRPALLTLHVEEVTGRQTSWRLLPQVAEDGFLLQPFLETQADFSAYLHGAGKKRIKSFRISSAEGSREFWKGAEIRFFSLPEIPMTNQALNLGTDSDRITNIQPVSISTSSPVEIFTVGADRAVMLHAPAEMTFPVPPGITKLRAGFGLRPGSYDAGGETDGVEFSITAHWPDGWSRVLWHRRLDPLHLDTDRGLQSLELDLPPGQLKSVTFRTTPGPAQNAKWDWSYWSRIHFLPEPTP